MEEKDIVFNHIYLDKSGRVIGFEAWLPLVDGWKHFAFSEGEIYLQGKACGLREEVLRTSF